MRKLLANSVLLLMLAVFFAPVFANATSASLPACCRRGGAHHCTVVAHALIPGENSLRAATSCPVWHPPVLVSSIAALTSSQSFAFDVQHEPLVSFVGDSCYFSSARSDCQRGPPELLP